MSKSIIAGVVATAAIIASAIAPASACPAGYVKGYIQGNKVCHIPPGGNGQLKSNSSTSKKTYEKKAIRSVQRAID